jgi:hypothetical protein
VKGIAVLKTGFAFANGAMMMFVDKEAGVQQNNDPQFWLFK